MSDLIRYNEIFDINDLNVFGEICLLIPELRGHFNPDDTYSVYEYFYFTYGDKYVSPFIEKIFTLSPTTDKQKLIAIIATHFANYCGNSLSFIYKALFADYNPINNYEMTETGTDNRQLTDNTTDAISKKTTDNTTTDSDSNTSNTVNNEIKKSGFNVATPVTDTTETNTETGNITNNETVERSGTESHTGQSDKTVSETNTHTFQRSGNIGVTTSQQMIESELRLRKNEFWKIFIDKFVNLYLLSIY